MTIQKPHLLDSQPLLFPTLTLTLSILVADSYFSSQIVRASLIALIILIALAAKTYSNKLFILSTCSAFLGYLLHSSELAHLQKQKSFIGTEVSVLAIIEGEPKPSVNFRQEVPVTIRSSQHDDLIGSLIIANLPYDRKVRVGEKIWLKGLLRVPPTPINPGVIDQTKLRLRRGIALELYTDQAQSSDRLAYSHFIQSWAEQSKTWIRHQLTVGVKDETSAKIILAMFLGEKPSNGTEVINAFRLSGTIHVFAVSGLHVMMIGLLFTLVLRTLGVSLYLWVPFVILIMFFYAIITGMNPPAMRAAIMGAIVLSGLLLSRKPSLPNSLWLSAIIAMLWSTHCIFLPGFQLSYAVLISICMTGKWWSKRWEWLSHVDPFFPKSLFTRKQRFVHLLRLKSASTLSVSSSAWFGSSFLIWIYFGLITPLAILVSLPILLLVFTLLSLCCLSLTLGSISDKIASPLNQANALIAHSTYGITHYFSSIDQLRYQRKPWASAERVIIYSIPDGGAAHYISIGGGVMLDAGNTDQFYRQVWPSLRKNGARIDSLIASHTDADHIQGLTPIIEKFPIKQLIIPNSDNRSSAHRKLTATALNAGVSIIHPSHTRFKLTENTALHLIDLGDPSYPLADDRCCTYLLQWRDQHILFCNDIGILSESRIREKYPHLTADIVILGKHSNDHSLSIEFLRSIKAKTVIATRSHYPEGENRSAQWIQKLENFSIQVYLLDKTGGIILSQHDGLIELQTTLTTP